MPYFVGQGGQLTVQTGGQTLTVNITGATAYSDSARTSSVSFPTNISADTTYYFMNDCNVTLSAKQLNGLYELSGQTFNIQAGQGTTVSPFTTIAQQAAVDSRVKHIVKAANESVTSSTTLQDDDDFTINIGANEKWRFRFLISLTAANTTMDLKMQLVAPAGATGYWGTVSAGATTATGNQSAVYNLAGSLNSSVSYASFGASSIFEFVAYVATAGTAGTVKLQWAQDVSDPGALTFNAGSLMTAERVG
jgi:hypothetical protein